MMSPNSRHYRLLALLLLAGAGMGAVAYASVPLYSLFCKATGYGGTTQRASAAPAVDMAAKDREITVTFDSNVDKNLPWDFKPEVHSVRVKTGESHTVKFIAHNRSSEATTGMATFNVQPDKAGSYFNKLQCFCFDKQELKPGQTREMTVQFFVDPSIASDPNTNDVQDITLSYTFFRAKGSAGSKQSLNQPIQPQTRNPS